METDYRITMATGPEFPPAATLTTTAPIARMLASFGYCGRKFAAKFAATVNGQTLIHAEFEEN